MKLKKKKKSSGIDTQVGKCCEHSTASELGAVHQGGNGVHDFKKKKKMEDPIELSLFSPLTRLEKQH